MNFDALKALYRPTVARHLTGDLGAFCRAAFPVLHPGSKLSWTWSHDLIAEHLSLVAQRKTLRLIINTPPRFLKTTVVSVCFPVWRWLRDPTEAFLCCSYETDLANTHNLDRRRLILSPWFQGLFADRFRLNSDRNLVEEFTNSAGGMMGAASVGSRAQGRGGSCLIVDDPLSAEAAYSDVLRKGVNDWCQFQLPQRLNDPATSQIVLVMQRLHEADPTGFLLENEPGEWTHLKLPLVAQEDETLTFPVSGRTVHRKKGDCLDPKRFPPKVVAAKQRNRLAWSGQYLQEPAPIEGNLIRRSDVRYFGGIDPLTGKHDEKLPASFDQTILSVDCSFKDLATSDFVAIAVIGISGRKRFLLHVVNAHLDAAATEAEIRRQHDLHTPVSGVLVEDKANGSAVIQRLKANVSGVVEIQPEGGKVARMFAAAPEWQAGDWYVERNAAWTEDFLQQITMFPNARNDDMADAMSQAAIWLQSNSYVYGYLDWAADGGQERTLTGILAKGISIAKDIWGHVTQSPRSDNVDKKAMFSHECGAAGTTAQQQVTQNMSGKGLWEPEKIPPCPHSDCKASCRVAINNQFHCNQCGRDTPNPACSQEIMVCGRNGPMMRQPG